MYAGAHAQLREITALHSKQQIWEKHTSQVEVVEAQGRRRIILYSHFCSHTRMKSFRKRHSCSTKLGCGKVISGHEENSTHILVKRLRRCTLCMGIIHIHHAGPTQKEQQNFVFSFCATVVLCSSSHVYMYTCTNTLTHIHIDVHEHTYIYVYICEDKQQSHKRKKLRGSVLYCVGSSTFST